MASLTFSYQPVSEKRSKICGPNPSQQFACAKHKAMVLQSREVGTISRANVVGRNHCKFSPYCFNTVKDGRFIPE